MILSTNVMFFSLTVLVKPLIALDCVADIDLSNCSPTKNIIVFHEYIHSSWKLHPVHENVSGKAIHPHGACSKIYACSHYSGLQNFSNLLQEFYKKKIGFLDCLHHYCELANSSQICCEEGEEMPKWIHHLFQSWQWTHHKLWHLRVQWN